MQAFDKNGIDTVEVMNRIDIPFLPGALGVFHIHLHILIDFHRVIVISFPEYNFAESRGYGDISSISYTDWQGGNGVKEDETQIKNTTLYRFRLSYDDFVSARYPNPPP